MKKKEIITVSIGLVIILFISVITIVGKGRMNSDPLTHELNGTVMNYADGVVTVQDETSVIYTCGAKNISFEVGDNISILYTGILNDNNECQVINYESVTEVNDTNGIPANWSDKGIFSAFYKLAYNKLKTLNQDEKIGQILLARYPDSNQIEDLKKYNLSGFVFFEKDFKDKTKDQVVSMTENLQKNSKIPLLTAVDEEGGSVVRVSSNPNLAQEKFKSSSELYDIGGFPRIKEDTINKSKLLYSLGLNLNLAPVVDVSTDPNDYMYNRSLKQNTSLTSTYAKTVIEASKGTGVSYTLKHFPGYGNNADTHTSGAVDSRSYEDIKNNDLPPFKAGIDAGAEAVLVSHNVVNSIDNINPASLSSKVHNVLRNDLGFTGIIITDDIAMGAVNDIDDKSVKAVLAGNDMIITTDYEESFNSIKNAVKNGTISEDQIDKLAFRVLAWKYYKLLMVENEK